MGRQARNSGKKSEHAPERMQRSEWLEDAEIDEDPLFEPDEEGGADCAEPVHVTPRIRDTKAERQMVARRRLEQYWERKRLQELLGDEWFGELDE